MSTQTEREQIAVLQNQVSTLQVDLKEVKADIKTIITTLDGSFVTKGEFTEYKKSQIWQKVLVAIGFAFMGALVTYFFSTVS